MRIITIHCRIPLAAITLAILGCTSPNTKSKGIQATRITSKLETRTFTASKGTVGPWNIGQVAPKIHSLAIIPNTITMKIGDNYQLNNIEITCLDHTKQPLGRLIFYNTGTNPQAIDIKHDEIISAKQAGEYSILFRVPFYYQSGGQGSVPEASLKVIINQ